MVYPDDARYLTECAITITTLSSSNFSISWGQDLFACTNDGCQWSKDYIYCCCKTNWCNTVSNAILGIQGPIPYYKNWGVLLCIAIVLLQMIISYVIYFGKMRLNEDILPSYQHIDFSCFKVQANYNEDELENIKRMPEEEGKLFDIKGVSIKAVVSFSCDTEEPKQQEKIPNRLVDYNVDNTSTFEEIFAAILQIGPQEVAYDQDVVMKILKKGREVFCRYPNIVRVNTPIAIYGDMHGQYTDLWRWFHLNGWPTEIRSLFLGDYVDRGPHGVEIVVLLVLLKILYPGNMFLCRGNHEDGQVNQNYSFYGECISRFMPQGEDVFNAFERLFAAMPMCAQVGGKIFCMHGGLTPLLPTLVDIDSVRRPTNLIIGKEDDFIGILWSDPKNVKTFKQNMERDEGGRGIGYLFGDKQIRTFCRKNKLQMLVRGHQVPMHGYEFFSTRLVTLFSAPGYRREKVGDKSIANLGAALLIDEEGRVVIVRLTPDGTVARKRWKLGKPDCYTSITDTRTRLNVIEEKLPGFD